MKGQWNKGLRDYFLYKSEIWSRIDYNVIAAQWNHKKTILGVIVLGWTSARPLTDITVHSILDTPIVVDPAQNNERR